MPQSTEPLDHRVLSAAKRRKRMLAKLSDAALRVVARNGLEGVTVDAVIQEAGVSRGTFYKYYDATSSLIAAVGAELAEDLILTVSPALQTYDDPAERLATGFRLVMQCARETPLLPGFLIRAGWPATDLVPAFSARVGANLAAGIEQARFRNASLMVASAFVGGAVIGMMATLTEDDGGPEDDSVAAAMLLLSFGLPEYEAIAIANLPLPQTTYRNGLFARTRGRDVTT